MCIAASNNTKEVLQWFLRPPWEGKNWFQDPLTLPSLLLVCINIFPLIWIQLPHDFTRHIGLLLPVYKISYIWHIWLWDQKGRKTDISSVTLKVTVTPNVHLCYLFFHGWGPVECILPHTPLGWHLFIGFLIAFSLILHGGKHLIQKYDDLSFLQS